jgi:hypothetical protein
MKLKEIEGVKGTQKDYARMLIGKFGVNAQAVVLEIISGLSLSRESRYESALDYYVEVALLIPILDLEAGRNTNGITDNEESFTPTAIVMGQEDIDTIIELVEKQKPSNHEEAIDIEDDLRYCPRCGDISATYIDLKNYSCLNCC